jgi:uncharacterized protein YjbJ (UPF0337 family)
MAAFDDKLEGKGEQVSGKLKEMAGRTFNDEDLAAEGIAEQAKGNIHEGVGEVKETFGDLKENLKDLGR